MKKKIENGSLRHKNIKFVKLTSYTKYGHVNLIKNEPNCETESLYIISLLNK